MKWSLHHTHIHTCGCAYNAYSDRILPLTRNACTYKILQSRENRTIQPHTYKTTFVTFVLSLVCSSLNVHVSNRLDWIYLTHTYAKKWRLLRIVIDFVFVKWKKFCAIFYGWKIYFEVNVKCEFFIASLLCFIPHHIVICLTNTAYWTEIR